MAVDDEYRRDAVGFQAITDIVDDRLEDFLTQGQRPLPVHPVGGYADGDRGGHDDLRIELQRGILGYHERPGGVHDHRQVLVVLLGAAGRDDRRPETACCQCFTNFLPRAFVQQYFPWIDVPVAGEVHGRWTERRTIVGCALLRQPGAGCQT